MRVLIVDDDALVINGLRTIIELATKTYEDPYVVCATGKNGQEAMQLYQQHKPNVVLMDIRMPEMDGITAGKHIMDADPDAKLIYLTTFLEDEYIVEALKLGAKGYLMKTNYESIIPAIEAVVSGQRVFGDDIVAKIPGYFEKEPNKDVYFAGLTERESELVKWVAEGLNNKEIAEEMHFSEGTIRNYVSLILEKLQLRDRTQLAIYYYKNLG